MNDHHKIRKDVERFRRNIEQYNPVTNAVLSRLDGLADEQIAVAERADERVEWIGLLQGVPITIKDCLDVAGYRTTYGSAIYRDHVSNHDSAVVTRLRRSGAVLLAKSHLTEFCYGATGENDAFGNINNPWGLDCVPGGSSSGAAASVAADMCRIAIGSDTGGSIRIPASFCGLVGLRPTFGRVSNADALALTLDYDTIGPLARSVADVARCFAAIAGHDPADPASVERPVENFLPTLWDGVEGLRIGLPRRFYFEDLEDGVGEAVEAVAQLLEGAGARLVDIDVPDPAEAQVQSHVAITRADMADIHRHEMDGQPEQIGPEVLRRLRLGLEVTGRDYAHSRRWMAEWKRKVRGLFATVDLILTPTAPCVAPLRSEATDMVATTQRIARFTSALGCAGLPSMTVPCGFGAAGMPIGAMLSAKDFDEALIFRAGIAFSSARIFTSAALP